VIAFLLFGSLLTGSAASRLQQVPTPTCAGSPATQIGTEGADVLDGTPGDDVIVALGGDDVVNGGAGDDKICAGDGKDTVDAGDGVDVVEGGAGADTIAGGDGGDDIFGGSENDTIDAGPGGDGVSGDQGDDTLTGGDGTDLLYYIDAPGVMVDLGKGIAIGDGSDTLAGFEATSGSGGNDTLIGDSGLNFFLPIGGAKDVVHGGEGLDFILYLAPVEADLQTQTATGLPNDYFDEGTDTFDGIEGLAGGPGSTLSGDGHDNYLFFSSTLIGRGGDDVLVGDVGKQSLFGGPGADLLRADSGADRIDGGPGRDIASYAAAANGVRANLQTGRASGDGNGVDTLKSIESIAGSAGPDLLTGNTGPNSLYGKGGDDALNGGRGDDFLSGGGGTDRSAGGKGSDYCVDSEQLSSCEFSARTSESQLALGTTGFRTGGRRSTAPSTFASVIAGRLRAVRAHVRCSSGECGARVPGPAPTTSPFAWPDGIDLLGAGAYDLGDLVTETDDAPACQKRAGSFRTWVVAPKNIDPVAGTANATEFVYWSAVLKRVNRNGSVGRTVFPTLTGHSQISGPGHPNTGVTAWLYDSGAPHFPDTWRKTLPARGQYKWIRTLRWKIGELTVGLLVSNRLSHYVQPGNAARPYCKFG
jgi:Ca2+-binding RTX toxin-like protein